MVLPAKPVSQAIFQHQENIVTFVHPEQLPSEVVNASALLALQALPQTKREQNVFPVQLAPFLTMVYNVLYVH